MKCPTLALVLMVSLCGNLQAADPIDLDYQYPGSSSDLDLSAAKGSIRITTFGDTRSVDEKRLVSVDGAEHQLQQPVAEIISTALRQAFEANDAPLVDEGQRLTLEGNLTEFTASSTADGIEVQTRTSVTLKDQGRTVWEGALFSRTSASTLEEALRSNINRVVEELLIDDYFLMELEVI